MDIELATDYVAKRLASGRAGRGNFLEIGLGSLNYSFEWAQPLGYQCYAVEPLPTDGLKAKTSEFGVDLTEAAIAATTGQMPIYVGWADNFGH
jgi:hypothetical protein